MTHNVNNLVNSAWERGYHDGFAHSQHQGVFSLRDIHRTWYQWMSEVALTGLEGELYALLSSTYFQSYCSFYPDCYHKKLLLPTSKSVSVIVTVRNEQDTVCKVLNELERISFDEIIAVINGTTDQSYHLIKHEYPSVTIVNYFQPLGHDVGRAIGAKVSQADMMLFLDGDIVIPAEQLMPYVYSINTDLDIALNNIEPLIRHLPSQDHVTVLKEFLNYVLGREDLEMNSLTAIPHAMSREAIQAIGLDNLIVPPKAFAIAIDKKLRIGSPASIDVLTTNRVRKENRGSINPVAELIIGDHIEALHYMMSLYGPRFHEKKGAT
ncbi:glycosyltransferase family 2 protein [Longirhabdus pacifica]|uniref:glycosyltransferase family 2 protein n=1 Tax=Longirhabdus pacifica TaxID=2305227 RepID=UPI001F0BF0AC|nr:glycosyltransferase [Longirhabdus pacifica]